MNTKNNKRRKESQEKIEKVFIELLQSKELSEITVTDIVKKAQLNRTTFYANYVDVYDLADKIRDNLAKNVAELYDNETNRYQEDAWLKLFYHIKNNQLFYKTYFKLGYDRSHDIDVAELNKEFKLFPSHLLTYHIEFFKAGFNAIVKLWLKNGCQESPEEMSEVLKNEYRGRQQ